MISDATEKPPQYIERVLGPASLNYQVGEIVWYQHAEWIVEHVEPKRRVILKRRDP